MDARKGVPVSARMKAKARRLFPWLESRSRWSQLRKLGDSGLVKASVLMPAFGYILLLNDNIHQYLTIKYDGWLLNYLPSVWRIWLLFYGSFFLAAGAVLFNYLCPPYIKQYFTAFEMVDRERDHRHHQHRTEATKTECQLLRKGLSSMEASIVDKLNLYPLQSNAPSSDALGTMLIHCWSIVDIKQPRLRILIMLLFGTGLTLLAVPAGFTFVQVTFLVAKHLFV